MILAERSEETQDPLQKGEHLGKPDLVSREYFRDPGRLADLSLIAVDHYFITGL